jgi:hypothetical protein
VIKNIRLFLGLLALLGAGLACSIGATDKDLEATVQALEAKVARTATAAIANEAITQDAPQTAEAKATQDSEAVQATRAAEGLLDQEALQATATAAVPVIGELRVYEVDREQGRVAWLHPPVALEIEGYQQFEIANDFMNVIAADFAMAADITWNTQYGTSGCGFMLRSNGDENAPSQYMVIATRGGNGHVLFVTLVEGEIANGYDLYPRTNDRSFSWENETTNRLAVVGRGSVFEIYTNGTWVGEIDVTKPPSQPALPTAPELPVDTSDLQVMQTYQNELVEYEGILEEIQSTYQLRLDTYRGEVPLLEEGFVAMTALSESGRTACQFDNAWLWLIEE